MGLLDDAIREHLELKRRRGGDPGEIALQERAALEPVYTAEDAATEGPELGAGPPGPDVLARAQHDDGSSAQDLPDEIELREDAAGEAPPTELAAGSGLAVDPASPQGDPLAGPHRPIAAQETAEIDMEAVLAADDERDGPQGDPLGTETLTSDGDGADWGFPSSRAEDPPPEPIPGQERISFE